MTRFAAFARVVTSLQPRTAVVLGSGLASAASGFVERATVGFGDVPGLVPATVSGHGGQLTVGEWSGVPALVFRGRLHFYEGHSWEIVTGTVRAAAELGVKRLVLTNAAGGINPVLVPGTLMAIRGHIKLLTATDWRTLANSVILSGTTPPGAEDNTSSIHQASNKLFNEEALPVASTSHQQPAAGRTPPLPGRFVSASPYSPQLIEVLLAQEFTTGQSLFAGVYAALTGPSYETPAEIRALTMCGADAVGMSTAREAEEATRLGLEVAGISCITNKAAGLGTATLDHAEVLTNANLAVKRLGELLAVLVRLV